MSVGEPLPGFVKEDPPPVFPHEGALWEALDRALPVGLFQTDAAGSCVYVNASWCALTGLAAESALGTGWARALHPDDRERVFAAWSRAAKSATPFAEEYRFLHPDGTNVWIYGQATPEVDANGIVIGFVGSVTDVSERHRAVELIRQSEAHFAALVNQAIAGIAETDSTGHFTLVNDRYCQITGYTRDELLDGMRMQEITHPDDLSWNSELFERLVEDGTSFAIEKRYIRKDGTIVWVGNSVSAVRDESGQPRSMVAVVIDVTERKAAEELLRETEERFRATVEQAAVGIAHVAPDGRWLLVNQRLCEITGYTQAELLARTFRDITHPDDLAAEIDLVRQVLAGEIATYSINTRYIRKDRAVVWVNLSVALVREESGRPKYFISVIEDITERKRVEAALREEGATLEIINDIGQSLTAELDLEALLQAVTDAATRLTRAHFGAFFYNAIDECGEYYTLYAIAGVPREAFANFPLPRNTAVFGPTFRGEGTVRLADVRQDSRYGQNPPYLGMPPGHLPVVSYLAVPVVGRGGEVLGGLFFGHPQPGIFDERAERLAVGLAAQAAIAVENARLFQQVQQELAARRRLEAEKEAFLDAVTHDLGNPLTTVKGQAQLLLRRARQGRVDPAAIETGLAAIDAAAERATRLIAELTDAARLEAQQPLELHLSLTDLVALARMRIDEFQPAAAGHPLQLEAGVPEVIGLWDADRLTRVLENLLANAVKFSPAGSTIVVRVDREEGPDGGLAVLTVADQGVGIPVDDLPHIFERFRRGGNVAGRIVGTGLGLWASQRIVAQHGGAIAIESTEGKGTTVMVRLPVAPPEAG